MNRKQFFDWMNDPALLNSESAETLQQLVQDYPYFQTARLLYLINLKIIQDYRYEKELKQVAAYMADRARLRDWLGLLEEDEINDVKPVGKEEAQIARDIIPLEDTHLKNIEEQIKESLYEIELKKSRLKELIEEKKAIIGDIDNKPDKLQETEKRPQLRPLPKDDLLEEYIREKSIRTSEQVNFFNPEESAIKSIEENDNIISETLARLVAAQGQKDKAIKIYQKLMLKNPQKSSYFAAQIEKLRKES